MSYRCELTQSIYGEQRKGLVQSWLDAQEHERAAWNAANQESREE